MNLLQRLQRLLCAAPVSTSADRAQCIPRVELLESRTVLSANGAWHGGHHDGSPDLHHAVSHATTADFGFRESSSRAAQQWGAVEPHFTSLRNDAPRQLGFRRTDFPHAFPPPLSRGPDFDAPRLASGHPFDQAIPGDRGTPPHSLSVTIVVPVASARRDPAPPLDSGIDSLIGPPDDGLRFASGPLTLARSALKSTNVDTLLTNLLGSDTDLDEGPGLWSSGLTGDHAFSAGWWDGWAAESDKDPSTAAYRFESDEPQNDLRWRQDRAAMEAGEAEDMLELEAVDSPLRPKRKVGRVKLSDREALALLSLERPSEQDAAPDVGALQDPFYDLHQIAAKLLADARSLSANGPLDWNPADSGLIELLAIDVNGVGRQAAAFHGQVDPNSPLASGPDDSLRAAVELYQAFELAGPQEELSIEHDAAQDAAPSPSAAVDASLTLQD